MGLFKRILFSNTLDYNSDSITKPNPNKYRFEITEILFQNESYTLLMVNYPDCITFNGNKLILIKGEPSTLELDPHFIEDNCVIARFIPTSEGIILAKKLIKILEC